MGVTGFSCIFIPESYWLLFLIALSIGHCIWTGLSSVCWTSFRKRKFQYILIAIATLMITLIYGVFFALLLVLLLFLSWLSLMSPSTPIHYSPDGQRAVLFRTHTAPISACWVVAYERRGWFERKVTLKTIRGKSEANGWAGWGSDCSFFYDPDNLRLKWKKGDLEVYWQAQHHSGMVKGIVRFD